jgi:hypothetical protein
LLAFGASDVVGQGPRAVATFPLREADLSLAADPAAGLILIFQPGVATAESRRSENLVWLRFHPDTALEWINSAASALRAPPEPLAPEGIQWSRPLHSLNGRGAFTMGRSRKRGQLQKGHWLAITDSVAGWRMAVTGLEADSLLRLILSIGSLARLDSLWDTGLEADHMDLPARIIHQPEPRSRGLLGQAVVQSMVGVDGRVEPGTSAIYLATDRSLIEEALAIARDTRFRPAERSGQPARQLVRQVIAWRTR